MAALAWAPALVLVVAFVLIAPAYASAYVNACPTAPGDATSSTDAAIEVRELRQEHAAACAAIVERLEAPLVERDPDEHDLQELAVWGGFLTFGGVLFLAVGGMLTGAFRFWRDA